MSRRRSAHIQIVPRCEHGWHFLQSCSAFVQSPTTKCSPTRFLAVTCRGDNTLSVAVITEHDETTANMTVVERKTKLKNNKLPTSLIANIRFRNRALHPTRWLHFVMVVALLLQNVSMKDGRVQKRKEQLEEKQW